MEMYSVNEVALCKWPLPLTAGAILGSNGKAQEMPFGPSITCALPLLSGMAPTMSESRCLHGTSWHLQYLPFFSPSYATAFSNLLLMKLLFSDGGGVVKSYLTPHYTLNLLAKVLQKCVLTH